MDNDNNNMNTSDTEIIDTVPKKKAVEYTVFDFVASIICFVLTAFLISSVTNSGLTVTWVTTAAYIGFFVLATLFITAKTKEFPLKAILPGGLALVSSFSFALHYNEMLNAVIFIVLMYLSGSYCIALTNSNIHSQGSFYYLLDVLKCEVFTPLKKLTLPLTSFVKSRKNRKKRAKTSPKKWLPIAVGVVFAIPVLSVVIPLLIKSDAAFDSMIGTVFNDFASKIIDFIDKLYSSISIDIVSIILAFIFAPYIFSVMFSFRHGVAKEENKDTSAKYRKFRVAPTAFFAAFLSIISVVYVIYLLSQTAYFFSAFSGHLPFGEEITVTEYARRGFFELAQIAAINFALVALTVAIAKRTDNKIPKLIKSFDVFLCVFTMLLCTISISKILLYINEFGLTEKRVYVFCADIVLLLVFLSIILRLFVDKFPYMKVIVGSVCITLAILGIAGVQNIIASYNTQAYLSGKIDNPDIEQLSDFDSVGAKYLKEIADSNTEKSKEAEIALSVQFNRFLNYDGLSRDKNNYDDYKASKFYDKYISSLPNKSKELLKASTAYVVLRYSDNIESVAVSLCNQTCVVSNANGTMLGNDEVFKFEFNFKEVLAKVNFVEDLNYVYTITFADGEVQKYESKSNLAVVFQYDFEDNETYFNDYDAFMSEDEVKRTVKQITR